MESLGEREDWLFPERVVTGDRLAADLSEGESGPAAANLVSNEDSYLNAISGIEEGAPTGGVYLGVGPEQNFSLIAACRPVVALIADYRRRNGRVLLVHKALMAMSADRVEYLRRLTARSPAGLEIDASPERLVAAFAQASLSRGSLDEQVREVRRYLGPLGWVRPEEWPDVATIQAKLAGPGMKARFLGLPGYPSTGEMIRKADRRGAFAHFLATEAAYRRVRSVQLGDRILPVVADYAGKAAMRAIASWMTNHGLALSVVYVSDVEFFLWRSGSWAAYVANMDALPRRTGARIVRTSTRPIEHPERRPGDQGTTVVEDLDRFLARANAGEIRSADDLFRA